MARKSEVEKTSKTWKGGFVIVVLIVIAGIILAVTAAGHDSQPWMWLGIAIVFIGVVFKKICRIGARWTSGECKDNFHHLLAQPTM